MALPSLTVAVSTKGTRALGLDAAAWPAESGVDYLVLVQEAAADPAIAPALAALEARPDITVAHLATTGLSRSRNAGLERAKGDVVLVTDDDVTHFPETHAGIRHFFAENPGLDLLTGQSFTPDGAPRKRFAPRPRRLRVTNTAGVSSHEMALRRAPVINAGIRFDERFGAGAGTAAFLGEEYIFLADCLAAGLAGEYRPLRVSMHPFESSGFVWQGSDAARARAAVFTRVFGRRAPLVRLAFALKNRRRFAGASDIWAFLRG